MPAPYFDSFFEMLIVQRNAARNTLEAYRRDLTDFQTIFLDALAPLTATSHKRPSRIFGATSRN